MPASSHSHLLFASDQTHFPSCDAPLDELDDEELEDPDELDPDEDDSPETLPPEEELLP